MKGKARRQKGGRQNPVIRRVAIPTVLASVIGAAVLAQSTAPFNDSIRVADLRADLFFLAGDGFRGRLVGTPENALAAEKMGPLAGGLPGMG